MGVYGNEASGTVIWMAWIPPFGRCLLEKGLHPSFARGANGVSTDLQRITVVGGFQQRPRRRAPGRREIAP
jgi:hypothetical protein